MTEALDGLARELASVKAYGRRNRAWIWFDIGLSIALGALGVLTWASQVRSDHAAAAARHAQVTITQLHRSELNGCHAGNQVRAAEIRLWDHVIQISQASGRPTRAQERTDRDFIAYV